MSIVHVEKMEADLKQALDEIERLKAKCNHYQCLYTQYLELQKVNLETIEAYKALLEVKGNERKER